MKASLEEIKSSVAEYVKSNKISVATFTETRDNSVNLLDKIAKVFTLDSNFSDKLELFEGENLPLGKTIEEWQADLILPEDYDPSGSGALAPHRSTYRPNFYSYTLGRKKIPQTIDNNDLERAVNNIGEFESLINLKTKRIYDSAAAYRYAVKREMIAKLIDFCNAEQGTGSSYSGQTWDEDGEYASGQLVRSAAGTNAKYGIVVKPYDGGLTFDEAVTDGYVIVLDLVTTIAAPTDTSTGEAFIKQVKEDVEIAQDISEGHSLNGNTIGAAEGLVLLVKQGVIPSVEVDVLAGAFHTDNVAFPAEVIRVKDFGSDTSGAFAVLVDRRGLKLHNSYRAVRENQNGDGDFLNLFYHTEDTAFISRNVFVKVYKSA